MSRSSIAFDGGGGPRIVAGEIRQSPSSVGGIQYGRADVSGERARCLAHGRVRGRHLLDPCVPTHCHESLTRRRRLGPRCPAGTTTRWTATPVEVNACHCSGVNAAPRLGIGFEGTDQPRARIHIGSHPLRDPFISRFVDRQIPGRYLGALASAWSDDQESHGFSLPLRLINGLG